MPEWTLIWDNEGPHVNHWGAPDEFRLHPRTLTVSLDEENVKGERHVVVVPPTVVAGHNIMNIA